MNTPKKKMKPCAGGVASYTCKTPRLSRVTASGGKGIDPTSPPRERPGGRGSEE